MHKRKNKDGLYEVVKRYFEPSAGQIPVLLVDTGTLIDFEERAKEEKSREAPHRIAGKLFNDIGSLASYVVFPRGIYDEIVEHHCKSKKNGKSEIGEETCNLVRDYSANSEKILEATRFDYHYSEPYKNEVDKLQELVEHLHREVNGDIRGGKKIDRDPISQNDLELLNTAIRFAVKSLFEFRLRQEESGDVASDIEGTYRIAVVSPDSHIYRPLNALITRAEGVSYRDYLQAFNPREYN